jgi:hypothetical protein
MALHAVEVVALFVDTVQQAPILVQCAQAAPEPWWKWSVQSVIPVAGGTLIAVLSFVQNRKSEQKQWERNQRAAHKQWILDQKRAEWSGLLRATAEVQRVLRVVSTTNKERIAGIVDELKPAVHELSVARANCFFLHRFFADQVRSKKFYSFIEDADNASESIAGLRYVLRMQPSDLSLTPSEMSRAYEQILRETNEITVKYLEFNGWLRKEAAEDLGVALSESTAGR